MRASNPVATWMWTTACLAGLTGCTSDVRSVEAMEEGPDVRAPGGKGDVFGEDDRTEPYAYAPEAIERRVASSTAAVLLNPARFYFERDGEDYIMSGPTLFTLGEKYGLCEDEPYVAQPALPACSGFLVGDDVLVTAGHCIDHAQDCSEVTVLFGYGYAAEPQDAIGDIRIPEGDVYGCSEVLYVGGASCTDDYAILRLDRKVTGRELLPYRREGSLAVGDGLFGTGHPSGLPMKITPAADIKSVTDTAYESNMDVFGGNSGSPVFDAETGMVEGIHVCSEAGNYMDDVARGCRVPLQCGQDGELCNTLAQAFRITRIADLLDTALGEEPVRPESTEGLAINEVDYDQEGADHAEFIEIVNRLDVPVALADLRLSLVNGANGRMYRGVQLALAGETLPPGGYLVVAGPTVRVNEDALVIRMPHDNWLQNGHDGVLIHDPARDLSHDRLAYEAADAGLESEWGSLVEGRPTMAEDVGAGAIGRATDGHDTDDAARDWVVFASPTPGRPNRN